MKRCIATACVLALGLPIVSGAIFASQAPSPGTQNPPGVQAQKTTPPAKTAAKKKTVARKKKKTTQKTNKASVEVTQVPAQEMPPVPATLMNSAPVKPSVVMNDGLLTIDAPNSTLSDVLSGIHKATGAVIEGVSPSERVAVKLGPGIPQQVIAALLRGTPYDYVILGTLGRQDAIARVVLTQSSGVGVQPQQQASTPPQPPAAEDNGMPERTRPDDAAPPENQAEQPQAQPQPAQPPQEQNPKSPEQLYQELQQLEQQKQPPR